MSTKIGDRLKFLRKQSGYSFREIERITNKGISNAYLCQIESGNVKEPSVKHLFILARLYNVEYMSLVELLLQENKVEISNGLLPCPLCGNTNLEYAVIEDHSDRSKVECCECECFVYADNYLLAKQKWNTRKYYESKK